MQRGIGCDRRRACLSLAAAGLVAVLRPRRLGAEVPVAKVAVLLGDAFLLADSGERPLTPGFLLSRGARVRTGRLSRLELRFIDGSVLNAGADTTLEIAHWAPPETGDGVGLVALVEGILRLAAAEGASWEELSVGTATAVASVRGTDWLVESSADGTAVFVVTGRVAVAGRAGGEVLLQAGEGTDVAPGAAPAPPKTWGAARRDAALERSALP